MFKKILIANRGEIACRVIKTARKMGILTVAVYSEADKDSLHVMLADEAVCIGPAASKESYLSIDKIIAACKQTGAEAVHPGYGFLSENAEFSRRLEEEGIKFIGPKHYSVGKMGDKIESKKLANEAKVNTIPGYNDAIDTGRKACRYRPGHRLSGDDQGLGRRWRQGPARCLRRQGVFREFHLLPSTKPRRRSVTTAS
jgi:propionyl-CoA carboxylase alpha chain